MEARLLINPWLTLRRITPMLQMAYAMRGLDRKRLLLYYSYGMTTSDIRIIRLLREYCVQPPPADTWFLSTAGRLANERRRYGRNLFVNGRDRVLWNTFQTLHRLDVHSWNVLHEVERVLAWRNWKVFQDIYPDPFFDHNVLAEFMSNPTVRMISQAIVQEKRWDDMPVLGDALEEAGCCDVVVLGHCRANYPHTEYCWLADYMYNYHNYNWYPVPERKRADADTSECIVAQLKEIMGSD